ncbi:glucosidase II beta subunit-like-domain-containing protein [Dimargaris cristalligena]|uniref:Glucosidase 2 subunit beta n=1 Tax=Dimargaris cristalligena TaxID=215637 RepID=A0A4P9ZQQ1_9FUNG|nr:glucosidase II beta subunit-like-domain-containing protein [Dimargaris cristalligena]|eukprot:RKP35061.1 glucosidase II beta subunit-like-domain-containing protein [Dimargaris cristalligena]
MASTEVVTGPTVNLNQKPSTPLYGVPPELRALYTPGQSPALFTCLDGSKSIPFTRVNNNYCDCPDGSDEPGTSACSNGHFYCANAGHRPALIRSSQVNDGICDPECCDGSDEYNGLARCSNRCADAHVEYQKELDQQQANRRHTSDLKAAYIRDGQQMIQDMDRRIGEFRTQVADQERAVARLQRINQIIRENHEFSENERKFRARPGTTLAQEVQYVVPRIIEALTLREQQVEKLVIILNQLKTGHNPNYHDMAVKRAIERYDRFVSQNPQYHSQGESGSEQVILEISDDETDAWDVQTEHLIQLTEDVVAVEEERIAAETAANEASVDKKASLAKGLAVWGVPIGLSFLCTAATRYTGSDADLPNDLFFDNLDKYNQLLIDAESSLRSLQSELEITEHKRTKDYGPNGEYGKIANECLRIDSGTFTYTVCLYGTVTQRDRNAYHTVTIGNFQHWGISTNDPSDPRFYREQLYGGGQQCWGGPQRSAHVFFECGAENKLLEVSEPSTCEYHLKVMSPAACDVLPADGTEPAIAVETIPHHHQEF